jgi:hypothetical protein
MSYSLDFLRQVFKIKDRYSHTYQPEFWTRKFQKKLHNRRCLAIFTAENQINKLIISIMLIPDKIIEIFCVTDDFCLKLAHVVNELPKLAQSKKTLKSPLWIIQQ